MLRSRTSLNKINRLHERALRISCSDYKSFNTPLKKDGSFSIHSKLLKCKFLHGFSPTIVATFKTQQASFI